MPTSPACMPGEKVYAGDLICVNVVVEMADAKLHHGIRRLLGLLNHGNKFGLHTWHASRRPEQGRDIKDGELALLLGYDEGFFFD